MVVNHSSVLKNYEVLAYMAFEKAIERKGYLSLRSIIESQYRFPRIYNIEPIRYTNIFFRIECPSTTLLSQQVGIGQYSGRIRPKTFTDERFVRLRKELGSAVYQLSKKIV